MGNLWPSGHMWPVTDFRPAQYQCSTSSDYPHDCILLKSSAFKRQLLSFWRVAVNNASTPQNACFCFVSALTVTICLVVCNLLSFLFGSAICVIILGITCMQYLTFFIFHLYSSVYVNIYDAIETLQLAWCGLNWLYCISLIAARQQL